MARHSAALVETERPLAPEDALAALHAFPGLLVQAGDDYATPLERRSGSSATSRRRIRRR